MIDFYTWGTPNGRKVSILLEELGMPYAVHPINIDAGEQYSSEFQAVSPNNKVPAIVDRDNGFALMESGAILLYLADKTGRFVPPSGPPRYRVIEWLMWQMGGIGPFLGQANHYLYYHPGKAPYAEARFAAEAQRLYLVLDRQLADNAYVAGDYSIADIAIWPWISRFARHRVDLNSFPAVRRWYLDIVTRPAVQRGYHVPSRTKIPMP
jgi:GST-like protein